MATLNKDQLASLDYVFSGAPFNKVAIAVSDTLVLQGLPYYPAISMQIDNIPAQPELGLLNIVWDGGPFNTVSTIANTEAVLNGGPLFAVPPSSNQDHVYSDLNPNYVIRGNVSRDFIATFVTNIPSPAMVTGISSALIGDITHMTWDAIQYARSYDIEYRRV